MSFFHRKHTFVATWHDEDVKHILQVKAFTLDEAEEIVREHVGDTKIKLRRKWEFLKEE